MAQISADRVKETTTTTGTGTITLDGAVSQFQAFSDVASNLDTMYYAIVGQTGTEWEVGLCTWNTGGTLTRTAPNVLDGSSGAATLVSFASGTKDVFITIPATAIDTLTTDITALEAATITSGNRIINGGMQVDQRNNGAAVVVTAKEYVIDRWSSANPTATGTITCEQSTAMGPSSYKVTATAAVTDLTTTLNVQAVQHRIEAKNVFDLNGEDVVLSFIVDTNWTGNLPIAFRNSALTRSYVTDVAVTSGTNIVSVPFTMEAATVAAHDTSAGLSLFIGVNNEDTYQTATVDAWQVGTVMCSTSSTMWAKTINNYVNITEVQLEKGSVPTQFERKTYTEVLADCQRYYNTFSVVNEVGYSQSATLAVAGSNYPTMRPGITASVTGTQTIVYGGGSTTTSSTFGLGAALPNRFGYTITTSSVLTPGEAVRLSTGGTITLDSEL